MASKNEPVYETQQSLYAKAMKKLEGSDLIVSEAYRKVHFQQAAAMFDLVGDYLDAPQKAEECRQALKQAEETEKSSFTKTHYEAAVFHMDRVEKPDEWAHLLTEFEQLGDYKDSKERADTCRRQVNRRRNRSRVIKSLLVIFILALLGGGWYTYASGHYHYWKGYMSMHAGNYADATESFRKVPGYRSSDLYVHECTLKAMLTLKRGEDVVIGEYKWKIIGRKNGIVTLIAAGIGKDHPFYRAAFEEKGGETSWETSSLRRWLNDEETLQMLFPEEIRNTLLTQTGKASVNEEYNTSYDDETEDLLTILSVEEAMTPKISSYLSSLSSSSWLRTPGASCDTVAYVDGDHVVRLYGAPSDNTDMMVRPVIKIDGTALMHEVQNEMPDDEAEGLQEEVQETTGEDSRAASE